MKFLNSGKGKNLCRMLGIMADIIDCLSIQKKKRIENNTKEIKRKKKYYLSNE